MNKTGTILIVTLWILAILSLMAVGVGFRMGLEIKLTGYNVSELKSLYLAKAGVNKAIAKKWLSDLEGKSVGIDALSQSWGNDEEDFRNFELGEGKFTLSYSPKELDRSGKEILLYGMEDESSRIDINSKKMSEPLKVLLMDKGLGLDEAAELVSSVKDWRDRDNVPSLHGAEESYYQGLEKPYRCSNTDFRVVEELLLVKGMTEELFYGQDKNKNGKIDPEEEGIVDFVSVFGEGKTNINTAPEPVLRALFGIGFPELVAKVLNYRKGFDGKIGTSDDRWFAKGSYVVHRDVGMVEIKNLNDNSWSGNIFGITTREWNRIKELAKEGLLVTTSDIYRINVASQVRRVKKKLACVVKFKKPKPLAAAGFKKVIVPPDVEYLYWHEE